MASHDTYFLVGMLREERFGGSGSRERGGDGSKTGLVMKKGKQKSMTGIGASLTTGYRDKEESNNKIIIICLLAPKDEMINVITYQLRSVVLK